MKYRYHLLASAALLAAVGSAAGQAAVDKDSQRNGPKVLQAFRDVVAGPNRATVRILVGRKEVALGTVVDADGWIVTKASALKGEASCKLRDGKVLKARVAGTNAAFDLAMLKIEATCLPQVEWRHSKEARVGNWVASPGIGDEPAAVGVVSVATRKYVPGDQPPKITDLNAGWLGVGLEESSKGAKISGVVPKSPAQKAGLKVNDIVLKAAGRKIIDTESLINAIGRYRPGYIVTLKIQRGKDDLDIKATLGKRPRGMLGNPQEWMGTQLSHRRGGFPVILQHDSGLRPEDCGGPLVDLDGKTVGINISRAGRTETYAIPSEEVQALLGDLKSGKLSGKDDDTGIGAPPDGPDVILRAAGSLTPKDAPSKFRKGAFMKVHEVKLSAGVDYAIELNSRAFNTYLYLEDAQGKKLAEDNDSGTDLNARIMFQPSSDGTYRILATSFQPNGIGDYTLLVRKQLPPEEKK